MCNFQQSWVVSSCLPLLQWNPTLLQWNPTLWTSFGTSKGPWVVCMSGKVFNYRNLHCMHRINRWHNYVSTLLRCPLFRCVYGIDVYCKGLFICLHLCNYFSSAVFLSILLWVNVCLWTHAMYSRALFCGHPWKMDTLIMRTLWISWRLIRPILLTNNLPLKFGLPYNLDTFLSWRAFPIKGVSLHCNWIAPHHRPVNWKHYLRWSSLVIIITHKTLRKSLFNNLL